MTIAQSIIPEMESEARTTRRVLEKIPDDKLGWRPHAKSMTLGVLGLHIAGTPSMFAPALAAGDFEFPEDYTPPVPSSTAEILAAHDASTTALRDFLSGLDDARALGNWTATKKGATLMTAPRIAMVRMIMLNHAYHHRGQLSVYLRLLDVPVPSIYGPSADENPFG